LRGEHWGKRGWGLCGGDARDINLRSTLLRLALSFYGTLFQKNYLKTIACDYIIVLSLWFYFLPQRFALPPCQNPLRWFFFIMGFVSMSFFKEFKTFIARGNMIDLATGIIIGTAFTAVVNGLVNDILMPPLGVLIGGIDFSNFFVALSGDQVYTTLKAAQDAGASPIAYGKFLNAVIQFLIVSFAVFVLIKQVNKLKSKVIKEEEAAAAVPTPTEVLLTEIRDLMAKKGS
jgi:large conductance mechanosensitive channel